MKLTGNYHDARIAEVTSSGSTLKMHVDLDAHWNNGNTIRRTLFFYDVRNIEALATLFRLHNERQPLRRIEVVGIAKRGPDEYLLDLCPTGPVIVYANGASEA